MHKSVLFLAAMAMTSPAMAATNLVTNGGFESGNTGFTSTYTYVTPLAVPGGGSNMVPENTYTVGTNAFNQHPSWASIGAFSGKNYLIANGSSTNDAAVWAQTLVGLVVGNTYNFSAWATNVCCNSTYGGTNISPLIISVGSGGTPTTIASSGALGATGTWTQFLGSFVATSTSTNLAIFTDVNAASGNDFGLDEISVTAAVPEPATWLMMMLGMAGVGFSLRRKKQSMPRVRFA